MASISTPVRAATGGGGGQRDRPASASELGLDVDVVEADRDGRAGSARPARLAAWMPAMRATPSTSPLGASPAGDALGRGRVSMRTIARRTARRRADLLGADVDHPRGALGVEVREVAHQAGRDRAARAPR
jgi:hypothetical protein